jgi:hypothetical protein
MTQKEWENLKSGDRLICLYNNNYTPYYLNKIARVHHYYKDNNTIEVSWEEKFINKPYIIWFSPSSFDLLEPNSNINLFNGGASC